jgi:hypothetical protein
MSLEPILSAVKDAAWMNDMLDISAEDLVDEITRYLAAVDAFRAEGREPTWRPENVTTPTPELRSPVRPTPSSAH